MHDYIILDTCIFRELGFKFYENVDYLNLYSFSIATNGEVIISRVVAEEFLHYFKIELLKKKESYQTSVNSLNRHPFFEFDRQPETNIDLEIEKSLNSFKDRISNDPKFNHRISILPDTKISGVQLTKFILDSKNSASNVQVRDYLIWDSLLAFAKENSHDTISKIGRKKTVHEKSNIVFITRDNGYSTNPLFQKLKSNYGVENIDVVASIPQYLSRRGWNLSFFTEKLISQKITKDRILKDLDKDINCLITYINPIYNECYEMAEVISRTIDTIKIEEYYSHLDAKDNKYKYVVHLKVHLDVLFKRPDFFDPHATSDGAHYLETYDIEKRPKFKAPVLFMYEGLLDLTREAIKSVKMIDFLPWAYLHDD